MKSFKALRERMVERTMKRRGIRDRSVLQAVRAVPREEFLPRELLHCAYEDSALPIDEGQTISQPYIVALMAEAMELKPGDRVLEVGGGSGYAAAVLGEIVEEVFTVELRKSLADSARQRLRALCYSHVHVRQGDGTRGWPEAAPFDAIAVAAGAKEPPPALLEQLAIGGRMVLPVGQTATRQRLLRIRRTGEREYQREELGEVRFVPLIGG